MPIEPEHVMWSTPERERAGRPHLVLLHGYGSNEGDLFQLAPYLPLGYVIAAPRAPLPHPMGIGFSWFPINDQVEGIGVDHAADDLAAWIGDIAGKASRVGILGFSQGGVLGLQVLRRHPEAVDALVMLASARHPRPDPGDEAMAARRPPVFSGRGTADDVIPEWRFADTADWLPEHSRLTERIYEGLGHAVSEPMIDDVTAFLRANLPTTPDWTIDLAAPPSVRPSVEAATVARLRELLSVVQERRGDAPAQLAEAERLIRSLLEAGHTPDAIAADAALSVEPVRRVADGRGLLDED